MSTVEAAGMREAARLKIVELLWEYQFTGTAWAGKFHLIRRASLSEYGALADKIFDGLRSIRALPIPESPTDAAGLRVDIDLDLEPGELRLCPFCGGKAQRHDLDDEANQGGTVIECERCGASSPVHFDRKENLEASWNERVLPTDAAVKALVAFADCAENLYEKHHIVQPFLEIYKNHGSVIAEARATLAANGVKS